MSGRTWNPLYAGLAVACLSVGCLRPAWGEICAPSSISVDHALADSSVLAWGCRGFGQVFLATDTLIQSISIWRPPQPALDGRPRFLFITGTDSLGRPDIDRLLLDAGPLVRQVGDGVSPVEYRWVFDPPFALPGRGKYFFDVLAAYYSSWLIPAVTTDPYPNGEAWSTTAVWDCSRPAWPYGDDPPTLDLVFEVRFCETGSTVAVPTSWGKLKVIYR